MDTSLTWECPLCGLETPTPEKHLKTHGLTIERVMEMLDEAEQTRQELARMLMLDQETGEPCPLCGHIMEDEDV